MNRRRRLVVRWSGCVVIAAGLGVGTVAGVASGWLDGFQARAADAIHPRGAVGDVAVVGIDARSIDELGVPWPWPRDLHAELVERLARADPEAIAYDVVFAPRSPADDQLAGAVEGEPVILAESVQVRGADERGVLQVEYATRPADQLVGAAAAVGHTAASADARDGVVRSVPLVVERGERYEPALALAALGLGDDGAGRGSQDVIVRPGAVQIGGRTIPTDDLHQLTVSWAPELTVDLDGVIPAAEVLAGRVDPARLQGRTVFVGVTDPTLGDHHLTPANHQLGLPGVLVHANAFNTMDTRSYLTDVSLLEVVAVAALLALVVAVAVQFLPLWAGALVAVGAGSSFVAWGLTVRADAGTTVNFVYPILAVALAVVLSGALRYVVESRQRRLVAALFSQYVPESVSAKLMEDGNAAQLAAGIRADVSVLFCDLRGFTAMSARTSPSEVRDMLDEYYEYASRIVLDHGGTLMQYVGDEVYAVFGAPVAQGDHAARAVAAARAMQEGAADFDRRAGERGWEPLGFGIGVNSGPVVAADSGSTWRRQYVAIGDTVNVGSRLCSQAGPGQVVISDATFVAADRTLDVEPVGPLAMKGVSGDFVAWRLVLHRLAPPVCAPAQNDRPPGHGPPTTPSVRS